jgi:hypothetical protein
MMKHDFKNKKFATQKYKKSPITTGNWAFSEK